MKTITKFVADDGSEHQDAAACIKRDELVAAVRGIMLLLGDLPKDDHSNFANGGGYIQHNPATVLAVRKALCEEAKAYTSHRWVQETIDGGWSVSAGWAGRMLGEIGGPLERAWNRIMCITKDGREYGQPYYALHPHESTRGCIVDRS